MEAERETAEIPTDVAYASVIAAHFLVCSCVQCLKCSYCVIDFLNMFLKAFRIGQLVTA